MSAEQLIRTTIEGCFEKYLYDEIVIGKLAHTEFKDGVNRGDQVDVLMPSTIGLFDYDGGDLPDAEEVTKSIAKIKIDNGKGFHFFLSEIKKQFIENAPNMEQKVYRSKEYAMDAVKQFAAGVDRAYGNLYTRAGHYLAGEGGTALTLTAQRAKDILAYMQAKFQRGDEEGHTNWIDGQMVAIVPPEYEFYLGKLQDYVHVESGHRKLEKGFVGKLAGWDIMVSNNVAKDSDGNYYPLFGIRGKTLAGGVSKTLNTVSYKPEKNFNTAFKGYGLFGVGAPRADFLGTAKIAAPLTIE